MNKDWQTEWHGELELWDENWQLVYALAEATMARTMTEFMQD